MENNLEKLRERLYKKEENFPERERKTKWRRFRKEGGEPASGWQYSYESLEKKTNSFPMKKILIIAVILFFISAGAVAFFLIKGPGIISSSNIKINIEGPDLVNSGEDITMDILIENSNKSPLELADILVEFPTGAVSKEGSTLSRERYSIGEIGSKNSSQKSINFVLFGEENEEKEIKIALEYRLEGSNAIFAKETEYSIKIAKPAVGISISMPKEINARQEMNLEMTVVSNSDSIIKDLSVRVDYPSGFQFLKSDPAPSDKNNSWIVGDLGPMQQRKISLTGILEGQDLEEKSFRVEAGVIGKDGEFIPYGSNTEKITIKKPFLDLVLFLNGKNFEDSAVRAGESVRGEITWKNNLTTSVKDAVIEIKIKGTALDEKSISADKGAYRAFDKTLVWNSSTIKELALINPGDNGKANFSFSALSSLPMSSMDDKNFVINLECSIKGKTASDVLGDTDISNNLSGQLKVASLLQLASKALHYTGDFSNSGPMPPKAGSKTTYTIVWSLGNTSNDFSNIKVRALLPSWINWESQIFPKNENISFNSETGEVVWSINNLQAGAGILWPAKQVSFQISLVPSLSQIGSAPVLVSDIILEGKDIFTGNIINEDAPNLTTILTSDPQFKSSEGKVAQ